MILPQYMGLAFGCGAHIVRISELWVTNDPNRPLGDCGRLVQLTAKSGPWARHTEMSMADLVENEL